MAAFVGQVRKAGYEIVDPIQILDAADFGVPQHRRRLVVLGYALGEVPPAYPDAPLSPEPTTVMQAIGDLIGRATGIAQPSSLYAEILTARFPAPESALADTTASHNMSRHTEATAKRFAATTPGSYEPVSRFFRLSAEGRSRTLRSGSGPSHGSFTAPRPIHYQEPRCITVREAARLQSFPDWFAFHPTIWHAFRQIGNSVPPLFARSIAEAIHRAASGHPRTEVVA